MALVGDREAVLRQVADLELAHPSHHRVGATGLVLDRRADRWLENGFLEGVAVTTRRRRSKK